MAEISASFTRGRFQVIQYRPDTPLGGTVYSQTTNKQAAIHSILSEVVIKTHYTVNDPDHVLCILGSSERLGNWEPSKAICMTQVGNSGLWTVSVPLPENVIMQWKLVVLDKSCFSVVRWEERDNHTLTLAGPVEIIAPWNYPDVIRKRGNGERHCHGAGNWNESGNLDRRIRRTLREKERDTESISEYGKQSGDGADSDKDVRMAPIKYMTRTNAMNSLLELPGPSSYRKYDTYPQRNAAVCQVATVDRFRWHFKSEIISLVDGNVEDMLYTCTGTDELEKNVSDMEICIGSNESLHISSKELIATNSELSCRGIVRKESNKEIGYNSDSADAGSKRTIAKENGPNNASDELFETDVDGAMEHRPFAMTVSKMKMGKEYEPENASTELYGTDVDGIMEYRAYAAALPTINIGKGYKLTKTSNEVLESDVDDGMTYRLQTTETEMDKLSIGNDGQTSNVASGSESTVKRDRTLFGRKLILGGSLAAVMIAGAGYAYYKMKT